MGSFSACGSPCRPGLARDIFETVIARRIVGLVVVLTVLALLPAAYASPPDQTWIAGLYDNADYDDAVLFITSCLGGIQPQRAWCPDVASLVVGVVSPAKIPVPALAPVTSGPSRAPPLA